MNKSGAITCLFVDIGGVLLTNGWDHEARKRAAATFKLNLEEMAERHDRIFGTYEEGKISLDDYLQRVVFFRKRAFPRTAFRRFMFEQSKPFPEMIDLVGKLKARYGLKIVVVNNEGRELNAYRIRTFRLNRIADVFVSSCFVHLRKPDEDIFRLALDLAHVGAREVVFIENTPMFVQVAEGLGIRSILHTDYESTRKLSRQMGLRSQ